MLRAYQCSLTNAKVRHWYVGCKTGGKDRGGKKIEDKFKVAQDNAFSKNIGVSTFSHHLDDLAHHPSPLGLIAGILAQYLRIGIFTNKKGETSIVAVKTKFNELKSSLGDFI